MKKILLIIFLINYVFANEDAELEKSQLIFAILLCFIFLLSAYLLTLKRKFKYRKNNVKEDTITLKNYEYINKTNLTFDMQEVFLYFFKTINNIVSANNNIVVFSQKMFDVDKNNKIINTHRSFFGDYSVLINALLYSITILNTFFKNEVFVVKLRVAPSEYEEYMLFFDIYLARHDDEESNVLFNSLNEYYKSSKINPALNQEIFEKMELLKIESSKKDYYIGIKNSSNSMKNMLSINMSFQAKEQDYLFHLNTDESLDALLVCPNSEISKIIEDNLLEFNIKSIVNKSYTNLLEILEDGVKCPFRAVFINADIFNHFKDEEIEKLIKAQKNNIFKIFVILNNANIPTNVYKVINEVEFLALPYTIDNIRAVVNSIYEIASVYKNQ
ncbi:hypothetical protein [Campylobacter canadensis]|uniref:Uncharacterized protein n=1 Tax=Campylobacter canadensis TaxID=449520 RepID=A0ABS7WVB3_9BACT|nr:hypothetical protein [Campylobacter canadensis]MBZ7987864.1 hypothetical protein [Campylobacter canadensis]MBZ7994410.1 hypothetical protein [Campylobacter canadensis]MBZ7998864.1 hypothetical protein [Campylobacter canadensis]MBZ7999742.1 hypothetical protein [Campylobacter canadensis]MBZ8001537.1 hypothetical protein [Campylobacter canadensis]